MVTVKQYRKFVLQHKTKNKAIKLNYNERRKQQIYVASATSGKHVYDRSWFFDLWERLRSHHGESLKDKTIINFNSLHDSVYE